MAYDNETLNVIYDKTDGRCHICRKKLSFKNYGTLTARGAWEVDHSRPRARGGTDYLRNLMPSCTPCNRQKQDGSTQAARRSYGYSRAPLSREKRAELRDRNTLAGGGLGAAIGAVGGPVGMALGALVGGLLGSELDVE